MERIDVNPDGADVCLRTGRLSNLVPELREQLARNPWEAGIMGDPNLSCDRCTLTVRVPISIPRRDGRKLVLAPDGTIDTLAPPSRRIDDAMVKAIARAFRWRGMLENGTHATIAEIAAAEKINESYVGRVLRLT